MARSFNGSSDVITTASFALVPPYSFFIWINPSSLSAFNSFLGPAHAIPNFSGLQVRLSNTNHLEVIQANTAIVLTSSNTVSSTNTWYPVFCSNDGSTNYVGRLNGTKTTATSANNASDTCPYVIGSAADGSGNPLQFWPGSLDEAAFWSVVLTDGEASALEQGARAYTIRQKSLLAYLPLDGLQSPEPDLSGNKINGTLTGTSFSTGSPRTTFTSRWPIFSAVAAAPTYVSRMLMVFQ